MKHLDIILLSIILICQIIYCYNLYKDKTITVTLPVQKCENEPTELPEWPENRVYETKFSVG